MRRKQSFMFVGNTVSANGKKAMITAMLEGDIDGTEYVYYIDCLVFGENNAGKYHPADVEQYDPENF